MGSLRKMIGGGGAFVVVGRLESACTYCSRHDYNQYKRRITNDKKCLIFHVSSRNNGFIGTQSFREGLECFPVKTSEPQFSRGWNCSRLGKHVIGSQSRSELSRGEDEQFVATTTEAMLEGHVPSTTVVSKENLEEKPSTVSRRSTSRSQTDLNRASSSFSRVPSSGTRSSKKHTTLDVIEADDKQVAFTNFQLSGKILDVLEERGFHNSTPIQSATYELIHSGRDIIGRSRTGTGKTLAFVLPIMQRLVEDFEARGNERSTHIQCLVLAPTRELAKQVEQEFLAFAKPFHFRTSCFFGGSSYEVQHRAINRGIDILVATPGRLIDHLERGNIDLSKVKFFILDEADEMLSMGFAEDIEKILTYVPSTQERQTLLFSATIPPWIQDLARKNQNNPIVVDAIGKKDTKTSTTVEHIAIRVPSTELARRLVLESVLSVYSAELTNFRCIVFARTKAEVDSLVSSSRIQNGAAQALHGDITQKQREITLSKFREGLFQVLIATDVAARGLDISGVDLVIQYRIPEDIDMYIHRAGRTGRAGRQGTCVVLYTDEERKSPPSVQHVIETKAKSLLRSIQAIDTKTVEPLVPIAKEYIESLQGEEEEDKERQLPLILASLLAVAMGQLNMPQISMLSGEENMSPILVKSKTVLTVSYIVRVVSRLLEEKGFESRVGLVSLCADTKAAVFDLRTDVAERFVREANKTMESSRSQSHLSFEVCIEIPPLLEPSSTKYSERKREYNRTGKLSE